MSSAQVNLSADLLHSRSMQVVVIRLGRLSQHQAQVYLDVMNANARIDLANFAFLATSQLPFKRLSWKNGFVTLRFVSDSQSIRNTDWDQLHISRRVFGVIGLIHCPGSPDLSQPYDEFLEIRKRFPDAVRSTCFAFDPLDSQADLVEREDLIMFPNSDSEHLQFYMNTLLMDFASYLVADISRIAGAFKNLPLPRSPLDPPTIEIDPSKQKRLFNGRQLKQLADMALLCGSAADAQDSYNAAREACKSAGDSVWYAAAHEGLAACALALAKDDPNLAEGSLVQDVVDRLEKCVKALVKKPRTNVLQIETFLKLSRYYHSCNMHVSAAAALMRAYEVCEVLGAREQITIAIEAAIMCQRFGFHRKFGLFIREAALLYSEMYQWPNCHHLSLLTSPIYGLQCLRKDSAVTKEAAADNALPSKLWPTIQRAILEELTVSAQGMRDHERVGRYISLLLRSQPDRISSSNQRVLISELVNATSSLPLNTRIDMGGVPIVSHACVVEMSKKLIPCQRKPQMSRKPSDEVFLFRPSAPANSAFTNKTTLVVSCNELIHIDVHFKNPLSVPLTLEAVSLVCSGVRYESFPRSLHLPASPAEPVALRLAVAASENGDLTISGCNIRVWNIDWTHEIDGLPAIQVVSALPRVSVRVDSMTREMLFGEKRTLSLIIHNLGPVSISDLQIEIKERARRFANGSPQLYQSNTQTLSAFSCDIDVLPDHLPLLPGQETSIPIQFHAQMWCEGAEVFVRYAEDGTSEWYRRASISVPVNVSRGIVVRSVDLYPFSYALTAATSSTSEPFVRRSVACSRRPGHVGRSSLCLENFEADDCMLVFEIENSSSGVIRLLFRPENEIRDGNAGLIIEESCSQRIIFPLRRASFGTRDDDSLSEVGLDPNQMHRADCEHPSFVRCRNALVRRLHLSWFASEDVHGDIDLSPLTRMLTPAMVRHVVPDPFLLRFRLSGCRAPIFSMPRPSNRRASSFSEFFTHSMKRQSGSRSVADLHLCSCTDTPCTCEPAVELNVQEEALVTEVGVTSGIGAFNYRMRRCSLQESDLSSALRRIQCNPDYYREQQPKIAVPPLSNPLSPTKALMNQEDYGCDRNRFYPVGEFRQVSIEVANRSNSGLKFDVEVRPCQETAQGEFSYDLRRKLMWTGSLAVAIPHIDAGDTRSFDLNVCFLSVGRYHFEFAVRYHRENDTTVSGPAYSCSIPLLIEAFDAKATSPRHKYT